MKHGKKYVESTKLVEHAKLYEANEALELACKTATANSTKPLNATFVSVLTPVTLTSRFVVQ